MSLFHSRHRPLTAIRAAFLTIGLTLFLSGTGTGTALAKTGPIGAFGSWSAYTHEDKGALLCYALTEPTRATSLKGRGSIGAMVTHAGGGAARDQVSIALGYKPKPGSRITVTIGGQKFRLGRIQDNRAWTADSATDRKLVAAMRSGNVMTVQGTTRYDVAVKDTFSLQGFTRAYRAIGGACGL